MSFFESWGGLGDRFSDDWIVTPQAAKLFLLCCVCVLMLTPIFFGLVNVDQMSYWARLPWGILGIVGAVAIFFLWIGMWRYWARLDRSNLWIKRASFVVLLFGFWYGAIIYCALVYFPQVRRNWRPA
jgi:hypothetical protein